MAAVEIWHGVAAQCVSATNAPAVVTLAAAGADLCNGVSGLAVSYSATPTGGNVQIADGAAVVFDLDITSAGPTVIHFPALMVGSPNTAMTLTLAAGGSGIVGRLTPLGVAAVPAVAVP